MCVLTRDEAMEVPETPDELALYCVSPAAVEEERFPLSPNLLMQEQQKDRNVRNMVRDDPEVKSILVENKRILFKNDKIIVPPSLQKRIVSWYHDYLQHPGQKRMEATLSQNLTWPSLRKDVDHYVRTCRKCQKNKKVRQKYGHLPLKEVEPSIPWHRVNVDLIGPLTCKTPQGNKQLLALTMIDPATGWFEVKDIKNKSAEKVMEAFDNEWLARYPRPAEIGFDNGTEYKGVFKELCANYGMKPKLSTTYNPQSNGIVERVHLVLKDALRTAEVDGKELDQVDPWAPYLSAAAFAIRSTFHTTLEATPAQLVFGRDMLLPIRKIVNWATIAEKRKLEMERNNRRENAKRVRHEYQVGDKVFLNKHGPNLRKLETPREGPYEITAVYTNGTIHIQRGEISERVNIRRVIPSFE